MTDRLIDFQEPGTEFLRNPHPVYASLREQGPVQRVMLAEIGEAWVVVGYEEARTALAHPVLSKDWRSATAAWREVMVGDPDVQAPPFGRHMLVVDPPDHTRLRRLVSKTFTARRMEALRPRVQQITDELLDALPRSGRADLIDELAFPLPMLVICEVLGVPFLDRDRFRKWSNEVVAPTDQDAYVGSAQELVGYLVELVEAKRAHPGDDLFSALIQTTDEDGDRLSADELRAMAFLLLVAGHETTVNLIGNGTLALLRHPDQLAALRADFSLLDNAVEEILRYEGPVEGATWRFAAEPVEIGGTVIPGGAAVLVVLAAADRDPSRYPDPDSFDIRRDTGGNVAFGHGIHYCLGAPLARIEARIALRSLLERCPDLALDADPAALIWRRGPLMRGVHRLPVRY